MLAQLAENYPEDIRVAYRHFPLISIHDKAAISMQAAEAAGIQGKFWEMHDLLFETQAEWGGMEIAAFEILVRRKGRRARLRRNPIHSRFEQRRERRQSSKSLG